MLNDIFPLAVFFRVTTVSAPPELFVATKQASLLRVLDISVLNWALASVVGDPPKSPLMGQKMTALARVVLPVSFIVPRKTVADALWSKVTDMMEIPRLLADPRVKV